MDKPYMSAAEMATGLQRKSFSSVELTQAALARIARCNEQLNAFINITEEQALAQAKAADELLQGGAGTALTGVPVAIKDVFCTQDVGTTCGSRMLANFSAPYDAAAVEKCRADGLVMLGKTNMDEFAMGSSNENSFFGPVRNPWDLNSVPGGSSGGSAAAVAAALSPLALGTDTGGSVRQPAALCGITGVKPTYGRVSRWGMVAFASSLDQAGVFARSAEDAALLLQTIAGFDERDSTSVEQAVADYSATLGTPLEGLTIGLPEEYFSADLDSQIGDLISAAVDEYRRLGAQVKTISLPSTALAVPVYYVVASAEASSNLSRYDGVRYGYRCEQPQDLLDLYTRSRSEGFGREVQRRIMIGTYALSAGYYDAYYLKAQRVRRLISNEFKQALQAVDVIMGPTSPTVAFAIDARSDDPVTMYLSDIYTVAVSLAGLPAISIPVGFSNGLPVGLQIIGDHFSEAKLLNIAHQYQQVSDWHARIPPNFEQ